MVYHMTIPALGSHVGMTLRFARMDGRWRCALWISWDAVWPTTLHRDIARQIQKAGVLPAGATTDSWLGGLDWALTHAEWVEAFFTSKFIAE